MNFTIYVTKIYNALPACCAENWRLNIMKTCIKRCGDENNEKKEN